MCNPTSNCHMIFLGVMLHVFNGSNGSTDEWRKERSRPDERGQLHGLLCESGTHRAPHYHPLGIG